MKISLLCPKCQSRDIYRLPNNPRSEADPRVQLGWTYWSSIPVTRYLCGRCGFIEEWITAKDDLQALVGSLARPAAPEKQAGPRFQEVDPSKCPACGAEITPADGVCPSCGINFGLPRTGVQH